MSASPAPLAQDGLPPLREIVATFGLDARKSLGQNFLFDLNLTGRIARAAGPLAGVVVVEVGPGPGGLTRALLRAGARVTAVEMDRRCLPALAELAEAFAHAATCSMVKGFAVGRTIFADAAARWLAGEISDEAAIADMAHRFASLVAIWQTARRSNAA